MAVCVVCQASDKAETDHEAPAEPEVPVTPEVLACELGEDTQEAGEGVTPLEVLIAEDEVLIALSLKSTLQRHGYRVVGIARNGKDVVQLARQHNPDVVLMDVQMPGMTGLEATRRLMEESPTCVIVLTAYANAGPAAMTAGAMGFVVKPLTASQVPRVVAEARRRFARYVEIRRRSASNQEALEQWLLTQLEVE